MRLAVTGADGFLGRHVVGAAEGRDHEVRPVAEAQAAVHLAGWADAAGAQGDLARAIERNALSVAHLAAQAPKLEALVYASTTAICGPTGTVDAKVADDPQSAYAASKLCGEIAARAAFGRRAIVARMPNLYGPGQRGDRARGVIARWLRAASLGEPLPVYRFSLGRRVDFVWAPDAASVLVRLATSGYASPQRFVLVATGTSVPLRVALETFSLLWSQHHGVPVPDVRMLDGDDPVPAPAHGTIEPSAGCWCSMSLDTGLRLLISQSSPLR